MQSKNLIIEILGWYGALAILGAYVGISFDLLSPHSGVYQMLNLTGALGIMIDSYHHRAVPSVVLNIVWALLAITAIIRIVV